MALIESTIELLVIGEKFNIPLIKSKDGKAIQEVYTISLTAWQQFSFLYELSKCVNNPQSFSEQSLINLYAILGINLKDYNNIYIKESLEGLGQLPQIFFGMGEKEGRYSEFYPLFETKLKNIEKDKITELFSYAISIVKWAKEDVLKKYSINALILLDRFEQREMVYKKINDLNIYTSLIYLNISKWSDKGFKEASKNIDKIVTEYEKIIGKTKETIDIKKTYKELLALRKEQEEQANKDLLKDIENYKNAGVEK